MNKIKDFFLNNSSVFIIDGGNGSELVNRGIKLEMPLWSCSAVINYPRLVEKVHIDYLNAGSCGIVANTFRTNPRTLDKVSLNFSSRELTNKAVNIALEARDKINKGVYFLCDLN